jgi:hypothetical protein
MSKRREESLIINCYDPFSLRDETETAAFDNQSSSLIKLNNGTILYLREVNKFLALVCILREDNYDRQGTGTSPYFFKGEFLNFSVCRLVVVVMASNTLPNNNSQIPYELIPELGYLRYITSFLSQARQKSR